MWIYISFFFLFAYTVWKQSPVEWLWSSVKQRVLIRLQKNLVIKIKEECQILEKNCQAHSMVRIRTGGSWKVACWNLVFLFSGKSRCMIFLDLKRGDVTRNFMFFAIKYLKAIKSTKNRPEAGSQVSISIPHKTKAVRRQSRQN